LSAACAAFTRHTANSSATASFFIVSAPMSLMTV
jgi:hypothetical protein